MWLAIVGEAVHPSVGAFDEVAVYRHEPMAARWDYVHRYDTVWRRRRRHVRQHLHNWFQVNRCNVRLVKLMPAFWAEHVAK